MKKLVSLILAIMMIAAVGAAFADGAALTNHDGTETTNEVVRIYKEITVYNPANSTVNETTASYTYGISAGTAAVNITDKDGVQALTKQGVFTGTGVSMTTQTNSTAAVTTTSSAATTTLTYAPDNTNGTGNTTEQFTASATGTSNTKWIDINFSGVVFGAAGVYRYTITESGYTYNSNGVIEGNTGHTRYLDVYVKQADTFNDGSTAAEWAVYGYALFTTDNTAIVDTTQTGGNEATLYKTTGFVADTTQSNPVYADAYYTYNVIVNKTVVNDAAQNNNDFEFVLDFSNTTVTADVLPVVTNSGATLGSYTATYADITGTTSAGTAYTTSGWASKANLNNVKFAAKFGNGDSVTITGIPAGTTVTVKELNNVTGTTYNVKTTTATTNLTEAHVTWNNWSGTANALVAAKARSNNMSSDSNVTIDFTNTLLNISPTGYVSRFAPYALILVAGIALLIVAKKRKPAKDDEE